MEAFCTMGSERPAVAWYGNAQMGRRDELAPLFWELGSRAASHMIDCRLQRTHTPEEMGVFAVNDITLKLRHTLSGAGSADEWTRLVDPAAVPERH